MPLSGTAADVFGIVTICLASAFAVLSLICVVYSVYFRVRVQKGGFDQLGCFSGPWIIRVAFVLVAVWWVCGEVSRLTLLKGKGRVFTYLGLQEGVCKLYMISNVGFAEPALFLIIVTLLHASVRKDPGAGADAAVGCRWNGKAIGCVALYCLPTLLLQGALVFVWPAISNEESSHGVRIRKYFTSLFNLSPEALARGGRLGGDGGQVVCTYPLFSTILLGLFDVVLVCYMAYVCCSVLSLVINKRLQQRIYLLMLSALWFPPLRVLLLGFSVLPRPGSPAYEALVFLAFLALLLFAAVAVCVLVYYPVADALALRDLKRLGSEEDNTTPFNDYFSGASSLIVNQSYLGTATESDDVSTLPGSISFRTMIKDDGMLVSSVEGCEPFLLSPSSFSPAAAVSPYGSPFQGLPLLPLHPLNAVKPGS